MFLPPIEQHYMVENQYSLPCQLKPWMQQFLQDLPKLPPDPLSNAEPEKVKTTHLIWDVAIDFSKKEFVAIATYSFSNQRSNSTLILDTSNLSIEQILVNGVSVDYEVKSSHVQQKPDALYIPIPPEKDSGTVAIRYRTSPKATGIFWVDPQFTEGGKYPLVYTLFEPNEGASAIPGQHTPQVRLTYEINVQTGNPKFIALSSVGNNPTSNSINGEYHGLKMTRAIPLYLLSLHVGHLKYSSFDDRTGVYAEEELLEQAKRSFQKLPQYMQAAEKLCGPYNWGTYTPIQLGWPFPYGAMEHPCASTFGNVCSELYWAIPHELAHAWAGNDITNCNWQQFFWNEGLTTFLQHCISEEIWDADFASMITLQFLNEATISMEELSKTDPEMLKLCSSGSSFKLTYIPYAKGALFFFMLQEALGKKVFAQFLKDYMALFFQNSMSDERFISFLRLWLLNERSVENVDAFMKQYQILEWLHSTTIPSNAPQLHSKYVDAINKEILMISQSQPPDFTKIQQWDFLIQSTFLGLLYDKVNAQQLEMIDNQLHYTQSDKLCIQSQWILACIKGDYLPKELEELIIAHVIKLNCVYTATRVSSLLSKTEKGRLLLKRILDADQGRLFPITRNVLEESLSGPTQKTK